MITARYGSSAAVLDGKLYVAGGKSQSGPALQRIPGQIPGQIYRPDTRPINTVERYDPSANVWEEVPPMIKARSDFVLCSFD